MLDRLEILIGKENIKKIQNKTILVLGLGGVGGYTVESLIRSGINNIILVDFDKIEKTNLNRQIIALKNTIGLYKTDVFEERIKNINENVNIIKINKFIDKNNYLELFKYKIDYLIDCCDAIETKKIIINECLNKNIHFITSMGTGNKMNPSKFEIMDIRKTKYDKIAKIIRKWVKENNIKGKIMCVSSDEECIKTNTKIIGSNSFVPPSVGLLMTSYIINSIVNEKE